MCKMGERIHHAKCVRTAIFTIRARPCVCVCIRDDISFSICISEVAIKSSRDRLRYYIIPTTTTEYDIGHFQTPVDIRISMPLRLQISSRKVTLQTSMLTQYVNNQHEVPAVLIEYTHTNWMHFSFCIVVKKGPSNEYTGSQQQDFIAFYNWFKRKQLCRFELMLLVARKGLRQFQFDDDAFEHICFRHVFSMNSISAGK